MVAPNLPVDQGEPLLGEEPREPHRSPPLDFLVDPEGVGVPVEFFVPGLFEVHVIFFGDLENSVGGWRREKKLARLFKQKKNGVSPGNFGVSCTD
jgi:hypothetical protein